MSTSCVLRTAASSTRDTQAATALPPATAYGTPAFSRAPVARSSRWRTFSTARIILSQETSPICLCDISSFYQKLPRSGEFRNQTDLCKLQGMKVLVLNVPGLHGGYLGCYGNEWIETPHLD